MIERYSITAPSSKLALRFGVDVLDTYAPSFNAAPTHLLPVITNESPKGTSTFYWGTSPEWAKNKTLGERIINVRTELIAEKPTLKRQLKKSRCLIPADGFYAWKKVGKKTSIPYRLVVNDQELFAFAGLWEEFEDTDGNDFHTFCIITAAATGVAGTIHDRVPVILAPENEQLWLDDESSEEDLMSALVPYAADKITHYPVSPRINNASTNVPSLIKPTPPADQFGNLTLFD